LSVIRRAAALARMFLFQFFAGKKKGEEEIA